MHAAILNARVLEVPTCEVYTRRITHHHQAAASMEMNKAKNVAENGPYSNQGGLLKIEREQLQAGQQGPGSGQR